jgi:hypothetical protein
LISGLPLVAISGLKGPAQPRLRDIYALRVLAIFTAQIANGHESECAMREGEENPGKEM